MKTNFCKLLLTLPFLFLFTLLFSNTSFASKHSECARKVVNEALIELEKPNTTMKQKRQILIDKYMPYIDFEWNAKMALGIPYKSLTKEKQKEYIEQYTLFLAYNWLPKLNFDRKLGIKIDVLDDGLKVGKNDENVHIVVELPDSSKYDIYARIRYENNSCKVLNLVAEGIDLALSYRAQFESYIEEHGNEANSIIEYLKQQNEINKERADFVIRNIQKR